MKWAFFQKSKYSNHKEEAIFAFIKSGFMAIRFHHISNKWKPCLSKFSVRLEGLEHAECIGGTVEKWIRLQEEFQKVSMEI